MRALAKTAGEHGHVELIDVPKPEPGRSEALVVVDYAGMCGSDAGIYEFEEMFEMMTFPTVIGHEYTGRIVEVGDGVEHFSVGDRVVEEPIRSCGDCYQCHSGDPQICADAHITGVHHDGAFAPYVAVPEHHLHAVPDDVSPEHAAITEPASVSTRAVCENSRVRAGSTVLVEGPGPIGLLAAQVARAQGGDVVVSGVGQDADFRLPLARDLGFETANVGDRDVTAVADEATDGVGFDVVVDATGHPSGFSAGIDAVRKGGQIVLVGQSGTVQADVTPLVRGEVDVQFSYASQWQDFERALGFIRSGDIDAETFTDDGFSLLNADEAFETFLAGGTCKPVFDVSELRD
ncbi:MAG: zinc-binding dehydrogenase [Halobacteriaceae archaeon]